MLSILIPVYNFDVRDLVKTLLNQCQSADLEFEIICIDDNSTDSSKKENHVLRDLPNVYWIENESNTGRSAIRNQLAAEARYPYLLFLDCDSKVIKKDFIQTYLTYLPSRDVLVGGREYDQHPSSSSYYLHWLYGTRREQRQAAGFQSNNFLIPGTCFKKIRFDERILRYGHEDTLFGHELKAADIRIVGINNPVIHSGLEDSQTFLRKQEIAIENLVNLEQEDRKINTKLQRTASLLRKLGLTQVSRWLFQSQRDRIRRKLLGPKPNLLLLDLYKIGFYLNLSFIK